MNDFEHRTPSDAVIELDPHDGNDFRAALGTFPSGVVVVTGYDALANPVGMTCQSFSSASLDPALVVFLPGKSSTSFPHLADTKLLCINVLAADHERLSRQFARSGTDKWVDVEWTPGGNTAPRIAGANLWIEGTVQNVLDVGDHHVVVVEVTALATPMAAGAPMVFHQGRYADLRPALPDVGA